MMPDRFLPTTKKELDELGWDRLDVIIVTGDSYIDSPFNGAAMIGRVLENAGYKVGIIAQPDITSSADITRLGEPKLFWGVTAGSVDSLVANRTANRFKRKHDDYTPGGENNRRPDRACIAYSNLIRRFFKNTQPIVLGGIEASLRRVAHYDFWDDAIRRSILFDAKADYILYGMAEKSVIELAKALSNQSGITSLRGLCYISKSLPDDPFLELPSFEETSKDKQAFVKMFETFYHNNDAITAKKLVQKHGDRYLIQNPPEFPLKQSELDNVYRLPFQRAQHPYYEKQGKVKALETIRFSINTHRGCYGECNFCAIAVHEGRTVSWRSEESILEEARLLTKLPDFKGYIFDVGGPTANMYGFECGKKLTKGVCEDKRCIYPEVCPTLQITHKHQVSLLQKLRQIPGVKKVFVASGIRYDMVQADKKEGATYLKEVVYHHVSGQLKIAPEHSEAQVLEKMGKPGISSLVWFKKEFDEISKLAHLEQYLTYYLIAAHPGCDEADMQRLKQFASQTLHISPEQVQIFTPTPSTYSSLMYYTGINPFTHEPLFVEKDMARRERQKLIVIRKPEHEKNPRNRKRMR
jgi:uncharacterized radical SAM protein YgiQ